MIEEKRATKYKLAKVLIWRMSNKKKSVKRLGVNSVSILESGCLAFLSYYGFKS
jgi:hypothetical protein